MKIGEIVSKKSSAARLLGEYPLNAVIQDAQPTLADMLSSTTQKLEVVSYDDTNAEFISLPVGKGGIIIKASAVSDAAIMGSIDAIVIIKSIHGESQQELSFEMEQKTSSLYYPLVLTDKYAQKAVYIDNIYQIKVIVSKPFKSDVSIIFDKEIL